MAGMDELEVLGEDAVVETHGRWRKINKEVTDKMHTRMHTVTSGKDGQSGRSTLAYVAYDTESGTTMVWNEVRFRQAKASDSSKQLEKARVLKAQLERLKKIKHRNILKIRDLWLDMRSAEGGGGGGEAGGGGGESGNRLVYITELLQYGTLRSYINENRKAQKDKEGPKSIQDKILRRWSIQILSALHYLHTCTPPIKPSLTSDKILIDHLGVIKVDAINEEDLDKHVKTMNRVKAGANKMSSLMGWEYLAPEETELQSISSQYEAEQVMLTPGPCGVASQSL